MPKGLDLIRAEHVALDKVLSVIEREVDALSEGGSKSRLDVLSAAVYYVRVFPDRYHHPKEEQFLFSALRRHHPDCADLLAEIEHQHEEGAQLTAHLDRALKSFEQDGANRLDALKAAARSFVAFQRAHMGLEEREVLPLAREKLRPEDWQHIERAFERNSDPLFGENLASGFQALYHLIIGQEERVR